MEKINFAFFGTPEVASKTLDILYAAGYIPRVIVTSPDRMKGRGMHVMSTPVGSWAEKQSIPCLKPEKITAEFIEEFKKYEVDLSVVVAYGKILPENLIEMPTLGTINIHYSLLPHYRGASPVEQALLSGDEATGVSIQQMQFALDSGPIFAEKEVTIDKDATKSELLETLINVGGKLLVEKLPDILKKKITPHAQDESRATYCKKINKEDGEIDPNSNARENYNKYRAFQGWPGVYFFAQQHDKRIRIKITKATYKNDSFIIERIIPEGKKEISYVDFMRNKNT